MTSRNLRAILVASAAGLMFTAPAPAQQHESNPEALRAFEAVVKAYRDRPALTVKTTVMIELLEGDVKSLGSEVKAEFILAKDRVGVIKLRGFTCYLGGGTLTAVHETTEGHSYFSRPTTKSSFRAESVWREEKRSPSTTVGASRAA